MSANNINSLLKNFEENSANGNIDSNNNNSNNNAVEEQPLLPSSIKLPCNAFGLDCHPKTNILAAGLIDGTVQMLFSFCK